MISNKKTPTGMGAVQHTLEDNISPIQQIRKLPASAKYECLNDRYDLDLKPGVSCVSPLREEATNSNSFLCNEDGTWHDFAASDNEHGDIFNFIQIREDCDFPASVKIIADYFGFTAPSGKGYEAPVLSKEEIAMLEELALVIDYASYNLLSNNPEHLEYLQKRGLSIDFIKDQKIGFFDSVDNFRKYLGQKHPSFAETQLYLYNLEQTFLFPYLDQTGKVVYAVGRSLPGSDKAKYIKLMCGQNDDVNIENPLFGLHTIVNAKQTKRLIFAEGVLDALVLMQEAEAVIASCGGQFSKRNKEKTLHILTGLKKTIKDLEIIISFDYDPISKTGQTSALKFAKFLLQNGFDVKICLFSGEEKIDLNDLYVKEGAIAIQEVLAEAELYTSVTIKTIKDESDPSIKEKLSIEFINDLVQGGFGEPQIVNFCQDISSPEQIKTMIAATPANTAVVESKRLDKRVVSSPINGKKGGRPELDTTALVKMFAEDHKNAPYRFFRGDWYKYNGHFFRRYQRTDFEGVLVAWLQKKLPGSRIGRSLKTDMLLNMLTEEFSLISSEAQIPFWMTTKVRSPYCIPMKNCILDIEQLIASIGSNNGPVNDFMKDLSPDFFSTYGLDFDYEPDAMCPKWMKYLSEVQPTLDGQDIIQMMFGLSLVQDCRYEVAFYLFGQAGTGKSVCLNVLAELIGKDNIACVPLHRFRERFSLHPLTTHRLNLVGDMPTADDRSTVASIEGALKDIISGGLIDCEKKGQDIFTAHATVLNIFASNTLMPFVDKSAGVWDRLRIIPFDQVFRGTEKVNKNLKNEIVCDELPGVFNWAIQGLATLWRLQSFPEHAQGLIIKNQHRQDCDHELQFLTERVEFKTGHSHLAAPLYKKYMEWMQVNGYRSLGSNKFNQAVERIFPGVIKNRVMSCGRKVYTWKNLKNLAFRA